MRGADGTVTVLRTTAPDAIPLIAPGASVTVRDEDWLVRLVEDKGVDGRMVKVIGTSELVRGAEATFFTNLDEIRPTKPEETKLIQDTSPAFRKSRLFIESLFRKTPLPASETGLSVSSRQLLDPLDFQQRPVQIALEALRPRLLIADAVGLGKTLEVGMILTELIRRGRGDRILVVTPRHILEQFQHELWTRFAIPLVRLDSEGIQRVRQKIPATRNPFSYYKRVIISIDTLKNAGRYRHHLEGIQWDAAVFDECHNLVNKGTLNHELANVVAPRSRALILTSATPHNGDAESFANLIQLLDPTAIADTKNYTSDEIKHLYIRRHKADQEVSAEVGSDWADRLPPEPIAVTASPQEDALFNELVGTWLRPESGSAPTSGKGARLFPYTLLKAALSSQPALKETLINRRKTLAKAPDREGRDREDQALARLQELNDGIDAGSSAKLAALAQQLKQIGVGPRSKTRAVIFSERVATVDWLADQLPKLTGLKDSQILTMHGGKSDIEQQRIVEQFSLGESKVRLLITGDIASEGVNLHRQCHQLIHYDLPWSLITLEQRNGRIDRYGQRHSPEIRALLLTPDNEEVRGDVTILRRLLEKEDAAHRALGEAASLMGIHSAAKEEEAIFRLLDAAKSTEEKKSGIERVVPERPKEGSFDLAIFLGGKASATEPVAHADAPSLFESDERFLRTALDDVFEDPAAELEIREEPEHGLITLAPPADLTRRFDALPQSYVKERRITERLKLTSDREVANKSLDDARERNDSVWPEVGFLSSQHPIMDWAIDKVLSNVPRSTALVLPCAVKRPTFLIQGAYSNEAGEPTVVKWMAIDEVEDGRIPEVADLVALLDGLGIDESAVNSAPEITPARLKTFEDKIPIAVAAARTKLENECEDLTESLRARISAHNERLDRWSEASSSVIAQMTNDARRIHAEKKLKERTEFAQAQVKALETTGDPLVRVIAVLVPED